MKKRLSVLISILVIEAVILGCGKKEEKTQLPNVIVESTEMQGTDFEQAKDSESEGLKETAGAKETAESGIKVGRQKGNGAGVNARANKRTGTSALATKTKQDKQTMPLSKEEKNGNKQTNPTQPAQPANPTNPAQPTQPEKPEPSAEGEKPDMTLTKHSIAAGVSADTNPLKGLVPFAGVTTFPSSLEWFYFPVNAVNTGEGIYDWTEFEQKLDEVASRGHQAVLRFYYDYPAEESGVPDYLISKYNLKMRAYDEPVDLGGAGLCPDYSDENFRRSMQDFIAEFGKEYDGDSRIGFITEGLLGFWGEWHNWPFDEDTSDGKPDWSIPTEVYAEVYKAYGDAFLITPLCAREPKAGVDNAAYGTGYHDDSFAYATLSADKGGQDWSFMAKLKAQGVEDTWKTACIGGEVYPPIQGEIYSSQNPDPSLGIQNWEMCLEEAHPSWLMCDQIKGYTGVTLKNAIQASKNLGYDIQVTDAYFCDVIGTDSPLNLQVEMKNIGIAPFYYDHTRWPVAIGIKQGDTLIKKWITTWDICDIAADGATVKFEDEIANHELGKGEYSLCIKVINPLKGGVLFSFANKGQDKAGWLHLGTIQVQGDKIKSYDPVEDDLGPGEVTEPEKPEDGKDGRYEAENGILGGKASLSDNADASGGKMVGWIGGADGEGEDVRGTLTFDKVTVEEDGFYTVELAYVLGEAYRTATIDINGGASAGGENVEVSFASTGGWSILGTTETVIYLRKGVNTLKIHNDTGYAPNIDCITVTKGSVTGVSVMDGNLNDWLSIDNVYEDEFQRIKVTHDSTYLYFGIEAIGGWEADTDWKLRLDTDNDRNTGNEGIDYQITKEGLKDSNGSPVTNSAVRNVLIARNGNVIELMIRKDALQTDEKKLASTIRFDTEFTNEQGAAVKATGKMTEYVIEEVKPGLDTTQRFPGNNLLDWSMVDCTYDDGLQKVWVHDDKEYLYFALDYQNADIYPNWTIEMNTDADCTTGYQMNWIWNWESTGSDYKIENGKLYRYTNGSQTEPVTEDNAIISVSDNGKVEVKISKAVLGDSLGRTVAYGVILSNVENDLKTAYITNKGDDMLVYRLTNVTEPHFNGASSLYSGWENINAAEIAGGHKVWVADDEQYLYFAMEYSYDGVEHWQVLLNSDNAANTGMQNTWPFAPGGCDFLVEGDFNGCTLRYQEISDDKWTFGKTISDAAECRVDAENRTIEVKILKSALSTSERTLASMFGYGIRFINSGWTQVGGTNGGALLCYTQIHTSGAETPSGGEDDVFNGALTDWSRVSCTYRDNNMKIWVTDDADNIYIAFTYDSYTTNVNWAIELNTDGDTATGYQLDWIWAMGTTGADYVVDNWNMRRHLNNGTDWSVSDSLTGVNIVGANTGNVEVQILKSALATEEKALNSTIGYGILLKDASYNYQFGSNNNGDTGASMSTYTLKSNT